MRADQREPDLRGRRGQELDAREIVDELAHERDVRRVVLDVDDLVTCAAVAASGEVGGIAAGSSGDVSAAVARWTGTSTQNREPWPASLVKPTLPLHQLGESLADREPDAGALDRSGLLAGALERLEQLVALVGRDADAVVDHGDPHACRASLVASNVA